MVKVNSDTAKIHRQTGTWIDAYHPWIRSVVMPGESIEPSSESKSVLARAAVQVALMGTAVLGCAAGLRALILGAGTGTDGSSLGWFVDTFHHWQIAFLSNEIGFQNGFLRLWGLKGMEYFWGLLHPLAVALLFRLTGSIDILIPRLVGLAEGSITVAALFILTRRYFNLPAAIGVSVLAAVNPAIIVSDLSGMQEPVGIALMFLALLCWKRQPIAAGVLLGLAGMVRAEYWVFGAGLAVAAILTEREGYSSWGVALGWTMPTVLYMKYLWNYTGNPIYPVYWYFMGDAAGAWVGTRPLLPQEITAVWIARFLLPLVLATAVWVLVKRPRHSLLSLLGIGEFLFLCVVFGFTAFVRGFIPRLLVDRIFLMPHLFAGLFISVGLLHWLPRRLGSRAVFYVGCGVFAGLVAASQALWIPIMSEYSGYQAIWQQSLAAVDQIANLRTTHSISIPESRPDFTYYLATRHSVPATAIVGQTYDPFEYLNDELLDGRDAIDSAIGDWFRTNDIEILVVAATEDQYRALIADRPEWFSFQFAVINGRYEVYLVDAAAADSGEIATSTRGMR